MTGPRCRRRLSTPLLAACALWAGLAAEAAAQGSAASDRAVLEALYDATGGPDWIDNTNWKGAAPLGEWFGVTTDTAGRVTRLQLPGNGLAGPIQWFTNALTGPIPDELGRLENLWWLSLGGNELTGRIPDALGNLANLESLDLGRNGLTGPIPSSLGRLSNLRWLRLGGNELTGRIPDALGNLANLESLDLGRNGLTGPIPSSLGRLSNLRWLSLGGNELTGRIPDALGSLVNLEWLGLGENDLSGPIPGALGSLENLKRLDLSYNWRLSGPLPLGLQLPRLEQLDIFVSQACAPLAWRDWLATIDFTGRPCDVDVGTDVTIDVAVVYTPAVRASMGGSAVAEAEIDLMVAETNQAYAASGVHLRLALVERSEVTYAETGNIHLDFGRLVDPADGHLDDVHALRDRPGADLVHLMVSESRTSSGVANGGGPFSAGVHSGRREDGSRAGGAILFAHELGHNLGLKHDRYTGGRSYPHPAYGYVNQRALEAGSPESSHWVTTMAYHTQCRDADLSCTSLLRFSNPRQRYNGDPLGIPFGTGSGVTGPADAAAVLNVTGPTVAAWRDRLGGANQPPVATGTLPDREMTLPGRLDVDVSRVFVDPDGDPLSYTLSSSAPAVVTVRAAGARVTLTAVGVGTATIRVTASDPGGLSATQAFTVTVGAPGNRPPEPVGALPPLTLGVDESSVTVDVDVSSAFVDPDIGDVLTYTVSSSAPQVVTARTSDAQVTLTAVGEGAAAILVTATDPGGLSATQSFAVTVERANRPPAAVGRLPDVRLPDLDATLEVDVFGAFDDPDGDALTYAVSSSAPQVVTVRAAGARVTLTAVALGRSVVEVRATDADGLSAAQSFPVRVAAPFTDDPIQPGVTPIKAVHFTELRTRINVLRGEVELQPFRWTDPVLQAGVTRVRLLHLLELRSALAEAYSAAGRAAPRWTDASPTSGSTPIRAAHVSELRAAVLALE